MKKSNGKKMRIDIEKTYGKRRKAILHHVIKGIVRIADENCFSHNGLVERLGNDGLKKMLGDPDYMVFVGVALAELEKIKKIRTEKYTRDDESKIVDMIYRLDERVQIDWISIR
ncbi:hypothetical protein J4231_02095 [Candidatus Woesearchaeota archaeon]|nr:hypothetical protein [Candidatus Woesearchaeota archaeon]